VGLTGGSVDQAVHVHTEYSVTSMKEQEEGESTSVNNSLNRCIAW